ncbi:MAG TPA: hypothetical protein VH352_05095 [Pseudonocardiaceae bacterium]|nr:hypothetical protein [Pseudonocardiaceae bacterium]
MPTRLLAVAATGIVLSTVVGVAPGVEVRHAAVASAAPATGRILFAGTQLRSLGVVTGPGPSAPLFGPGPTHYDDQPDAVGGQLVFTSRRSSAMPEVFLRDATGTVHQLTNGMDTANPALSPDGTLVAFAAAEPTTGGGTQRDLWLVHTDGTGLRRLTDTPANDTDPTFSPDGSHIAYARDQTGTSQIFTQSLAGGPATQLTTAGGSTQPAWNPVRANLIAYTEDLGSGRRLRMIDGTTPGIQVLTGLAENVQSFSPAWQPNGNLLTFVSQENNVNEVFQVDTSNGIPICHCQEQLLLNEDRGDDTPTWLNGQLVTARTIAADQITADVADVLPDGTDPRDLGLSVLREDPGAATNNFLLFHPNPGFDPWFERQSYSPDGRQIAVTRFETVGGQRIERIWLANADGSDAVPLPLSDRKPGDWEIDPGWSPDGRFIVFTRQSPGGVDGPPTRIFIADVATGQVIAAVPPGPDPTLNDAEPMWSPDGKTIAFSRGTNVGGSLAEKHIWLTSATALGNQRDLTAAVCGTGCPVIDDSPVFSPDGTRVAFNREHDGMLMALSAPTGCRVLLPAGQNSCAGPIDAPAGPFQPRDISFSPDGNRAVLTPRRAADLNSPEMLAVVDVATGQLTPITENLPGRQKEPDWQHGVDLAVIAPPSTPVIPVNGSQTVPVTVTNHGPALSPGTTLTVTVPPGLRLDGLRPDIGTCDVAALRCDFGVLAPGQSIGVTATLVGTAVGASDVTWSVSGTVEDAQPADNTAQTLVPVQVLLANPALTVTVTPAPGYVGGTVTVTFTARNAAAGTATGLALNMALPAGVRVRALTAGCTVTACALPDLPPNSATAVQAVLAPTAAVRTTVAGVLTTTGTDADPADDTATAPLVVLQPKIVAVPDIGKPGFVTSVRGTDFPPGGPVTLTWTPGITAAAAPTVPVANGTFIAQLLIMTKDQTGPRVITASGTGFSPVTTPFLVVTGTFGPPGLVVRR